jgi:hypothetical protein
VKVADRGGYLAEAEVEAKEGREKEGTGGYAELEVDSG